MRVRSVTELDRMALVGGAESPDQPIQFRYHMGVEPMDLLPTTHAGLILVSERFRIILADRSFTGWATIPVDVHGLYQERIAGYHGLAVTGRCGAIDRSRARKERRPPPSPRGRPCEMEVGM